MIKFLIASYVAPLKALKCHSFQNFPKTYKKKEEEMTLKPALAVDPFTILKPLDENCRRCTLKLLYIIPIFPDLKNKNRKKTEHSPTVKASTNCYAYA